MTNPCVFSPDRRYRYTLLHRWDDLYAPNPIIWIGLNPSTADENKLDPTLRRIRGFSQAWGHTEFIMLNLYAFRATKPTDMRKEADPIGPQNDALIYETIRDNPAAPIVAAWGTWADTNRQDEIQKLIAQMGRKLECLGHNANGTPSHPLYLPLNRNRQPINVVKIRDLLCHFETKDLKPIITYCTKHKEIASIEVLELRIEQAPKRTQPILRFILDLMNTHNWEYLDLTATTPLEA